MAVWRPVCTMATMLICIHLAVMEVISADTSAILSTFSDDIGSVSVSVSVTDREEQGDHEGPIWTNTSTYRPLISDSTRYAMETALHVAIIPLIVLCGVIMNVINMAVFLRQGLSDRINVCLFSLAVSDTGYMVFMMANRFSNILDYIDVTAAQYWGFQSLSLIGIYVAFLNTSNCLTLLISLERCFCVVWPLKVKTIISDRTLKCLVVLAFIVSFLNNIMFNFKFAVRSYQDPVTNATRYRLLFTDLYRQHRDVIDFVLENVNMVVPTTSVTVVMATTTIIVVRMRSVLEWRRGRAQIMSSKEQREASLTRMLTVICVIYSVCTFPYVIHSFFRLTVKEFRPGGQLENTANATVGLVHAVLSLNASSNFLVYLTMSTRFRDTLHTMVARNRAKTTTTTATVRVESAGSTSTTTVQRGASSPGV